jgi:hypothetical protein
MSYQDMDDEASSYRMILEDEESNEDITHNNEVC